MTFILDQSIEIDAPPEVVWGVITDLPLYGEWNPFVTACESTLRVGDPIVMKVQIFAGFAQSQTEVIKANGPGQHLCYGLGAQLLGALESMRCHDVKPIDGARSLYRSSFELKGWISPVVRTLLGGRLQAGFESMTDAIGLRAAALHAAGRGTPTA